MQLIDWQCAACAVEFEPAAEPPEFCPICVDERQYVPDGMQRWTHRAELLETGHQVQINELEPGLTSFTSPDIGIGQSALLVQTRNGNLLFEVPGLLDQRTFEAIGERGGVQGIVASHPHMYGVQTAYSSAFENAPIYIAAPDQNWVQRASPNVKIWSEPFEPIPGIRLEQIGGHFPGSTVALWAAGAAGQGVLLAGDGVFPVADGNVTFLRSYPNRIPLSGPVVLRIATQLAALEFERLYNNFASVVPARAGEIVAFSAARYAAWASGSNDSMT
ncbi:hydrolase [Arthrobacter sp. MYb224]|uniref:hydrolase n=1 Tax=Arthrobacter sp. MYb224 TaxID=1848600 RepID=UPI000CFB0E8C|nr:hydrolase [Arthrobacter sp. MYb224]PRA00272.1 hydrolase [Arthrobacter sp. MYb224]